VASQKGSQLPMSRRDRSPDRAGVADQRRGPANGPDAIPEAASPPAGIGRLEWMPATGTAARARMIAGLQSSSGNAAVQRLLASGLAVQREPAAQLDAKYQAAVAGNDWTQAAILLNGFNDDDIKTRVAALQPNQVESMKQATPAWTWRVRAPLLDRQYREAVAAGQWARAAIYLNGFNDDDIMARLKLLTHAQHISLWQAARTALQGVSQHRITDRIGFSGDFSNELKQEMTEGKTTYVKGRYSWTMIDYQLEVDVPVKFAPDPGLPVPLATWQGQIDGVWNQFAVTEPGGRKIPIRMTLRNDAAAERTIKVVQNVIPGKYGRSADGTTQDRANAGMWYPVMPATTAPHEFGHLIGLPDEYQRYHKDFTKITDTEKVGPANTSGKTPLAIAKELHAALYLDDKTKRAGAATTVLVNCGLIVNGKAQQGDFAESVKAAYDDEYGGIFTKYLLEALRDKLPALSNWTLLSVFSYASGTIMGNPDVLSDNHDHPVEARHLRGFRDIVARAWPAFAWTTGPK
jgi:hypothetical protein